MQTKGARYVIKKMYECELKHLVPKRNSQVQIYATMAHSSGELTQLHKIAVTITVCTLYAAALPASPLHCYSMTHSVYACFTFGHEQETLHTLHKSRLLDHALDEQV